MKKKQVQADEVILWSFSVSFILAPSFSLSLCLVLFLFLSLPCVLDRQQWMRTIARRTLSVSTEWSAREGNAPTQHDPNN